jgi:short-subunit dehydrogenase
MTRWALVTGASRGIGLELSRLAAKDGYHLVLVARSGDELEAHAAEFRRRFAVEVLTLPLDLATRTAADAVAEFLASRSIIPDLLINNAGIGAYGLHREIALAAEQEVLDLNIVTLTRLTKRTLPGMLARGSGRILNVASVAAFYPGPYLAVYYASKAYVLSYSEAIAYELAGTGVTVTALCPGPTRSGFQARAALRAARIVNGSHVPMATAESVAAAGYRAMLAGRRVVIPGVINRLAVWAARFVPRRVMTALAARVSAPAS